MAYNKTLAERVRNGLSRIPDLVITEKKMFGGLAFLINGKMCINISGEQLMCRYDPDEENKVVLRPGYLPMIMKGRQLKGYCKVSPDALNNESELLGWVDLCLRYNPKAAGS